MKLYQIENGKSGRRLKITPEGLKWGSDKENNGSYFTKRELNHLFNNYIQEFGLHRYPGGDCFIHSFDLKICKAAVGNVDVDDSEERDDI